MEAENMDVIYLVQRQLDFCTDMIISIVFDLPGSTHSSTFHRFGTDVCQILLISTKSIQKKKIVIFCANGYQKKTDLSSFPSFVPAFWTKFSFVSK